MNPHRAVRAAAVWSVVAAFGCSDMPERTSAAATSVGEGGSPVSLDSALTLFRAGLEPIRDLESSETSVDRVVARLADIVERRDTSGLRALVMSRREFAWLYYPTSPFTRAPTKQEPALVWFLHVQHSEKGATRLLNRFGGRPLRVLRNDCRAPARREGDNVLWDDCVQRIIDGADTVTIRLFGAVYERRGRFKLFSYSNDL